jgi:hypothetical protein
VVNSKANGGQIVTVETKRGSQPGFGAHRLKDKSATKPSLNGKGTE